MIWLLACTGEELRSETPCGVQENEPVWEGHNPSGMNGSGEGLFVGDQLNEGFPEDMGVVTFLTFKVCDSEWWTLAAAEWTVEGDPFGDLGDLLVHRVSYVQFGPTLWEEEGAYACTLDPDTMSCELWGYPDELLQLKLAFETQSDLDGERDMVFFNPADLNTNEAGLFTLTP